MSDLRSAQWYGGQGRDAYIHRAWMRRGAPEAAFTGHPQIAIANTASDLVPCNRHLSEVAEHVAAGVWGGRRGPARHAGRVAGRNTGPPYCDAVAEHGGHGH